MFWRLGYAHTSPIETILDGNDYTLQQLLDEEDLVQECKQMNRRLVDYLGLPEQVEALVGYLVTETAPDADEKVKFVYPYKASEVLSQDLTPVYDTLFASEELVARLLGFLESQDVSQPNPLLTGYFCKVCISMLSRRPAETLEAIRMAGTVDLLMKHLGSFSVLELLLKIIGEAEEGHGTTDWAEWLDHLNVVGELVSKFDSSLSDDVHENASGALVALLCQQGFGTPWVSHPSPSKHRVSKNLLKMETVEILLDKTFFGSDSTMEHGLSVVAELVRHCSMEPAEEQEEEVAPCTPPADGFGRSSSSSEHIHSTASATSVQADCSEGLPPVLEVVARRLGSFVRILKDPPKSLTGVTNQAGVLDPPLGAARLKVLEVLSVMVMLGNKDLEEQIVKLRVLPAVLDIFFEYPWHNLMHNLVWRMFEQILKVDEGPILLRQSLIEDGQLMQRVADAFVANDAHVEAGGARKGNMGHLRSIANAVMCLALDVEEVAERCKESFWVSFKDTYLDEMNSVIEKNTSMNAGGSSALDTTPDEACLPGMFSLSMPSDFAHEEDDVDELPEDGNVVMDEDDDDEICAVAVDSAGGDDDDEDVIEAKPAEPEFRRMLSAEEAESALNAALTGLALADRGVKVPEERSPEKTKGNAPKTLAVKRASPEKIAAAAAAAAAVGGVGTGARTGAGGQVTADVRVNLELGPSGLPVARVTVSAVCV